MSQPIGVFDSGVGGLSVLDVLVAQLPRERFVYVGDTAHMPYGERSPEDIARLARGIVDVLVQEYRVKAVVVACNTSAGVLAPYWERSGAPGNHDDACPVPAIEPIEPLAAWLAQGKHPYRHVGLLATQTTIASGRYQSRLAALAPWLAVSPVACTGLAKAVEDQTLETPEGEALLAALLAPLAAGDTPVDALILGCTHYPFAAAAIRRVWDRLSPDRSVALLDPAHWMGEALQSRLMQGEALQSRLMQGEALQAKLIQGEALSAESPVSDDEPRVTMLVSGPPERFDRTVSQLPFQTLRQTLQPPAARALNLAPASRTGL